MRELARLLPDHSIAPVLNRLGIRSARGQTWTQLRVRNFRGALQIREGERGARHELILTEAACRLDVSKMTVVRLIRDGLLPASQVCAGARPGDGGGSETSDCEESGERERASSPDPTPSSVPSIFAILAKASRL